MLLNSKTGDMETDYNFSNFLSILFSLVTFVFTLRVGGFTVSSVEEKKNKKKS